VSVATSRSKQATYQHHRPRTTCWNVSVLFLLYMLLGKTSSFNVLYFSLALFALFDGYNV
jgi:hypothetical protein